MSWRVVADLGLCQGHQMCTGEAPDVFAFDDGTDQVGALVEAEHVGRLALAHLVPLTQVEVGEDPHRERLRYLTRQGCSSWITILDVSSR